MNWSLLLSHTLVFGLIFARVVAFMSVIPLVSSKSISMVARFALSMFVSICLFSFIYHSQIYHISSINLIYLFDVFVEVGIGLILGLFVTLIYNILISAAALLTFQFGFSAANVLDPTRNTQQNILQQLFSLVTIFVFFSVQGFQQIFIMAFSESFLYFNADNIIKTREHLMPFILHLFTFFFEKAFLLALPILGTLLFVNILMGFLAKAVPQINLLVLGFPITIGIGLLLLILLLPVLQGMFSAIMNFSFSNIIHYFHGMATKT